MADWIDAFPGLAQLEAPVRRTVAARSRIVDLPAGSEIFGPGKAPDSLLLLLDGVVRVQQVAETGREIVLYRVQARESCIMTTACLLAYEDYSAQGIAETDVRAAALPRAVFEDLVASSAAFRRFVFTAYARRMADLFQVIEEVAFRRIDIRLAQKLLNLMDKGAVVHRTHQELATELGTAREVVSRTLRDFQQRGWLDVRRGRVDVTDRDALARLAATG